MDWMKRSLLCKTLAFLLAAAALVGCVFSGVGVAALAEQGYYEMDTDQFLENQLYDHSYRLAATALYQYVQDQYGERNNAYLDAMPDAQWGEIDLRIQTDYEYVISDLEGNTLVSNLTDAPHYCIGNDTLSVLYFTTEVPDGEEGWFFYGDYLDVSTGKLRTVYAKESPEYRVMICFLGHAKEQILETLQGAIQWELYKMRGVLLGVLAGSLAVLLLTLVYLFAAVNHKRDTEELLASGLNRIPLDVSAVVYTILGSLLLMFEVEYVMRDLLSSDFLNAAMILSIGIAYVGSLMIVGWSLSLAAQIKQGGGFWWRNSLMGRILRLIYRMVRRLWKKCRWVCGKAMDSWALVPLVWHWLAGGLGFLLAFLIALSGNSAFLVLLVVLAAIGMILYNGIGYGMLLQAVQRMSQGFLEEKVQMGSFGGQYKVFADSLNSMADAAMEAARKQTASERMRTELITNVSHDIKTPLTSIVNYVDLLQKPHTPEEGQRYLEVLSRQSLRMKKLVEDLVEMSKATTGNLTVEITRVDMVEALHQALGEFSERLERVPLEVVLRVPQEPVVVRADGRLVWRVLSNLLSNAVKYAMPGTRFYVTLQNTGGLVLLSLKNISRDPLNISAEELMERFVRGDASRNTEGSGLGLNIAKSLMELQHGSIELFVDGDLFKATLLLPGESQSS